MIYDTAGLDEGDQGRVPHWNAIEELYTLIRQLDGVSLLIYCMRGRVKENAKANWLLFNRIICGEKVPIIAVVTGLEIFDDPDDWWKDDDNRRVLKKNQIRPRAVGCVVSYLGRQNEFADLYAASEAKLRHLIMRHYLRKPWSEEKEKWFANIYSETISSGLCFTSRIQLDYTEKMQNMINDLIKETAMKKGDSKRMNETLIKSEKRSYQKSPERAHIGSRHNVILFGESGCGKSSIVNMIVGEDVAKVSSGLKGCTFQNDAYEAMIDDTHFVIYDTAGLNEGERGRVPHWKAIRELYLLIRRLDGVSLLIYCIRGRVRENAKVNWDLFNKVICGGKVPTIAIVTGLENYGDPDEFLKDEHNSDVFKENGMEPRDVGCIVSIRGKQDVYADTYNKSQVKVRNLVTRHFLQKSWSEEKEKWFAAIYSEAYNSGLCFTTQSRMDYSTQMREALDEFVQETGMKKEDIERLRATLVKAENQLRKRGFWIR